MLQDIAVLTVNEAEAFLVIEPLHGSFVYKWPRVNAADLFEIWRKVVSPDAGCAARPSRSAEARSSVYAPFSAGLQGYPARV
jgi:hypothetical protein